MTAEQELTELLSPQVAAYAGDFDEWYRSDDPEGTELALELVQSMAGARVLNRSEREHALEKFWSALYRDMAEEYAQAASWDRERGFFSYGDRRGR